MKKLLIITILLCSFFRVSAQNTDYYDRMEHIFGNIDKTKVTTGILKEFGIRFNEVEAYNGVISTTNWVDRTYTSPHIKYKVLSDFYVACS